MSDGTGIYMVRWSNVGVARENFTGMNWPRR